jgi:ribosome biogenesis GTPase A
MATTVSLSLVSHTNVGKTTLARTLLGRDVGEVRDAPHVTTAPKPGRWSRANRVTCCSFGTRPVSETACACCAA